MTLVVIHVDPQRLYDGNKKVGGTVELVIALLHLYSKIASASLHRANIFLRRTLERKDGLAVLRENR